MSATLGQSVITPGDVIELHEESRTYYYPGGDELRVENIRELVVRPSGSHRLKDEDGDLIIMSAGWLAIHIVDEKKEWTV